METAESPLFYLIVSLLSPQEPLFNQAGQWNMYCHVSRPIGGAFIREGGGACIRKDETWGAGNSILSGITLCLSAGCVMNSRLQEGRQHRQLLSELRASPMNTHSQKQSRDDLSCT